MTRPPLTCHPCGCTATDSRWLSLCAQHVAESRELHERAQREYRERRRELLGMAVAAARVRR